jgi:hypothetical protein
VGQVGSREVENRLWSIARELDDIKEELHDIKVFLFVLTVYAGAWLAAWLYLLYALLSR